MGRRGRPLLVREAGGFATDPDGGARALETGHVVAGNEPIHKQLLAVLKDATGQATPRSKAAATSARARADAGAPATEA